MQKIWKIKAKSLNKDKVGKLITPDFKALSNFNQTVIKIMEYCQKKRYIYQWNRMSVQKQTHTYLVN